MTSVFAGNDAKFELAASDVDKDKWPFDLTVFTSDGTKVTVFLNQESLTVLKHTVSEAPTRHRLV